MTTEKAPATAASPLDEYLAGIDPARAPLVIELDRIIRAAAPQLDAAVKYRMLTYAIGRDWWRWVAAIGVTKGAVNLRLLYGTRLEAGAGVLRPGTSHLANLDLAPGANDVRALAPGVYFVRRQGSRGQGFEDSSVDKVVITM